MRPKSFAPAEIRELIGNLRSNRNILNGASPDDAADALEYLIQFVEWRPIETAPKDGSWFLAKNARFPQNHPRWVHYVGPQMPGDDIVYANEFHHMMIATHFLPLPPPPASQQGQDQDND